MVDLIKDSRNNPVTIIVVDDDETDRQFVVRALKNHDLGNSIIEVQDGEEALTLINKRHDSGDQGPYVMLLDLNMPGVSGTEFLDTIKNHPIHDYSFIFAYSTSDQPQDIIKTSELGVVGYFNKFDISKDTGDFINTIKRHCENALNK